ncbi:hypothetical protein ABPG77_001133 [Micractinium sp. CCAP 211/92]
MTRSTAVAIAVVALLLAGPAAAVTLPSWYKCTCTSSSKQPCVCPSTSPPGGLSPSDIPQFVLFTHDDAVTTTTASTMHEIVDGKATSDGCPVVATLFIDIVANECDKTMDLYNAGFEVADHTLHHIDLNGQSKSTVETEVMSCYNDLGNCGVPKADIRGFRQPYLSSNPTVRQVLYENGFLYDSTVLECPDCGTSDGMSARVWPYTLQDGVAQNCEWFAPSQTCISNESYPGMWEVPLYDLSADGIYSMDYGDDSHDAYDVLKANFDAAYSGNRAPMPVYIHSPWLVDHVSDMEKFIQYVLSKPNTYFVTVQQLLAWMANPIPASEITPEKLGCGQKGGLPAAGTAAKGPTTMPSPAPTSSPVAGPPAPAGASAPAPAQTPSMLPGPAPGPAPVDVVPSPEPTASPPPKAAAPRPAAAPPSSGASQRGAAGAAVAALACVVVALAV